MNRSAGCLLRRVVAALLADGKELPAGLREIEWVLDPSSAAAGPGWPPRANALLAGVHCFQQFPVALIDLAALDLQAGSEMAGLLGELVIEDRELAYLLEGG